MRVWRNSRISLHTIIYIYFFSQKSSQVGGGFESRTWWTTKGLQTRHANTRISVHLLFLLFSRPLTVQSNNTSKVQALLKYVNVNRRCGLIYKGTRKHDIYLLMSTFLNKSK